jgi:hypothetical protein
MAKSTRRRKQDRARVESRHAGEARAEAERRADELFGRATDMALAPAGLAMLIAEELADSTDTGRIAHARLLQGAEPGALAETARLLLAACAEGSPSTGGLPPGVLAFAAVAAHASGDEAQEARWTDALLDVARTAGEAGPVKVAGDVLTWTHPDRAFEMTGDYLLAHPHDKRAFWIWHRIMSGSGERALRIRLGLDTPVDPPIWRPGDPGFSAALAGFTAELADSLRDWKALDPEAKAHGRALQETAIEIQRRHMMPAWQVKRLLQAEADG